MGLQCVSQQIWLKTQRVSDRGLPTRPLTAFASGATERRLKGELLPRVKFQRGKSLAGALQRILSLAAAQPLLAWQTLAREKPSAVELLPPDTEPTALPFWVAAEAKEETHGQTDEQEGAGLLGSPMDVEALRLSLGKRHLARYRECALGSGRRYSAKRFLNRQGQRIFTHQWLPPDGKPLRATLVLLHGLNEHSGRYEPFARRLNAEGFAVVGMDWIGHGMSEGLHGFVDRLDHVADDARRLVERVQQDHPGLPCFMFGHSMGASIILKIAADGGMGNRLAGLVLTAPAVRLSPPPTAVLKMVAPIISALHPTLPLARVNKRQLNVVSRDLEACAVKYRDPLVYTGAIRARMGYEILRLVSELERYIPEVRTPFIVLHGTGDLVTDCQGSVHLHAKAATEHKDLRLYEGLFHDLLMEPEKEQITEDILSWLESRLTEIG